MLESACENGKKSFFCCSCDMPIPVSVTETVTLILSASSQSTFALTVTLPLAVNLYAFDIRFIKIWCSRTGSPMTTRFLSSPSRSCIVFKLRSIFVYESALTTSLMVSVRESGTLKTSVHLLAHSYHCNGRTYASCQPPASRSPGYH